MIELKQVTFQYENAPESVYSVHNVDLTIQNGEFSFSFGKGASWISCDGRKRQTAENYG